MGGSRPSSTWKPGLSQVLLLLLLSSLALAQEDPCADAPNEAAKIICRQLNKWDSNAREASTKKKVALPPGALGGLAAELAPIASSIYQCVEMGCVCTYMRGSISNGACTLSNGQAVRKAFRKEYRMMSDDERQRFHDALNTLKQNGEYTVLARIHSDSTRGAAAHSGPAFLPWHREYIKRVELAIRNIDPTLFMPYWDSTLDGALPRPADSILFTDDFAGTTDSSGLVSSGPFANWRTLEGRGSIKRAVGAQGSCFKEADIDFVMRQTAIDQVLAYSAPQRGCTFHTDYNCLEYTHGNVHIFVGGDMYDTATSANDPLFFMHHSFVDSIWERWRQQRQSRGERESAYPQDNQQCASGQHFGASLLAPFGPFRNYDGLSNAYTDKMYEFAPRPACPGCGGSKWLFCDNSHGNPRCAAKVRMGGVCTGFARGEQPCYGGVCQNGRCVAGASPSISPGPSPPPTLPPATTRPPPPRTTTTAAPVSVAIKTAQETCFNENECCATWATTGECTRNAAYMRDWCKASCRVCVPASYKLADDCRDRHINCAKWQKSGECTHNPDWMTENCRKSCSKCGQTRAASCGGGGGGETVAADPAPLTSEPTTTTTTAKPQSQCANSEGCYNENQCCPVWGLMGECTRNPQWMACNCRVSCGHCVPNDYYYGGCNDYHKSCGQWSRSGECLKNPWMLENCRSSCGSCKSQQVLRSQCSAGSSASTSSSGSQSQWGQRQRGGWGFEAQNNNWGGNNNGWNNGGGWNQGGWGGGRGGGGGGWGFGDDFWGRRRRRA